MAKEREKVGVKAVDEEAEKVNRYLRLHADNVEEMVELPLVRVGGGRSAGGGEKKELTREMRKTRSNEPGIASLIESDEIQQESLWGATVARRGKLPWGWVAIIGGVFAAGMLWSLVAVKRSEGKRDILSNRTERMLKGALEEEGDAERMIDGIGAGVRGFFGSGSVEEMLRFSRQPQRVGPLMKKYYREKPPMAVGLAKILSLAPMTIDNRATFWIASCELEDGRVTQVLVEAAATGDAKVDWETYVSYQPMDWDDFARSRPGGYTGDFRVYVEPDNFYSYEFADSGVYSSFRLTALKGNETLYGYAPRGGELDQKLTEIIKRNGGGVTPVILRLHLPDGLASKHGVVMEKLVSPRWVFVDHPEKENP